MAPGSTARTTLGAPTPRRKSLVLVVTQACNLRCSYCYEPVKRPRQMALATAQDAIARHLQSGDFDETEIDFHGGEPFLCFDFVREVCEWTWARCWTRPLVFFATTNGTLVHGQVQDWLRENAARFWCGLSLDGTKEMHNENRSDSFDRIDLGFFKETWPEQPVKMTVSPRTLGRMAEGVIHLHELGIPVNCNLACGLDWSATPSLVECYEGQLRALVDYYLSHPEQAPCSLLTLPFHRLRPSLAAGSDPAQRSRWCGIGKSIVAVDVDGQEYPCQVLMPFSGSPTREPPPEVRNPSDALTDFSCKDCYLEEICPTCYAANFNLRGDLRRRDATECRLFRIRAQAAAFLLAEMLASQRSYSSIADWDPAMRASTAEGILRIACAAS